MQENQLLGGYPVPVFPHVDGYPFDPDAVYRTKENIKKQELLKDKIIAAGKQDKYLDRLGHWYLKAVATECADVPDNAYFDGAQTDVAIERITRLKNGGRPFFFGVGYYRPHLPFNAPKKYWDMYVREKIPLADNNFLPRNSPAMAINTMRELRSYLDFKNAPRPHDGELSREDQRLLRHGYLASLSYVDAQIGRLLDALEQEGLKDNTIVVLWGDHGWKLGEHRSWCKMTNYEIDTLVPLIFSGPGVRARGARTNRLTEFVDIYPTLCDLAGLKVPSRLEGTSAVPLLGDPDREWKNAAFSQFLREGKWVAPDGVEYMGYSIRTERYRYVEWIRWKDKQQVANELYDHYTDPRENQNIAGMAQNAALVEELSAWLKAGWKAARPSL